MVVVARSGQVIVALNRIIFFAHSIYTYCCELRMLTLQQKEDSDFFDKLGMSPQIVINSSHQHDHISLLNTKVLPETPIDDEWLNAATTADAVHGTIRLHPFCERVRFTPQVQRLGHLRQLGGAFHVFLSADHKRLVHSLGVSHLCTEMLWGLWDRQKRELDLEARDIRNVALAGLCHDLGHGPLSHAFEKEFLKRRGHQGWTHEDMSIKMLEYMLEDNNIEGIDKSDARFIESLIKGVKPSERPKWECGKRFLFDIVSNDQNGIDMDRADYMQRDALQCGQRIGCSFQDVMSYARVVDDQICYPLRQMNNVWNVYRERVRLFQDIYTHRRVKAVELMTVDALVLADQVLGFSGQIQRPQDFMSLDDGLISAIASYERTHPETFQRLSGSDQNTLKEAEDLLKRLGSNDLYDCCGECEVPERMLLDGTWERLRAEFRCDQVVPQLLPTDILLDENRIDYGKGGMDPMATVGFYTDEGIGCAKLSGNLSQLQGCNRPNSFKVRTLRVFARKHEHRHSAIAAFQEWCRSRLGPEVHVRVDAPAKPHAATCIVNGRKRIADPLTPRMKYDIGRTSTSGVSPPPMPLKKPKKEDVAGTVLAVPTKGNLLVAFSEAGM
ncbi:hypothetical protein Vretimale_147 [Volvox reticuliferus]|uniref:HD/PDEase domain-containing protein n=1 Tax=Volvox reticuliferus TaxID=1737510 RepID=A0A8J4FX23_9CHLO|nr:hypothetical protein Vretifemale_8266 [Volvox reticuliferus]GIL93908.1 hypothetical protein Vretimale_147 [Volvox reticuliferus]